MFWEVKSVSNCGRHTDFLISLVIDSSISEVEF